MNKRIDDIEFLRAIAVIAVIVFHANGCLLESLSPLATRLYPYFGGGFGVDLFFAISGFVIARQLLPQLQGCTSWSESLPVMIKFWVRRMWRLWPSAWLWLAVILVSVVFFNQSGAFGTARANIEATVAGVLHVANLRFAQNFGVREVGASFPYWSLSLEEQFYFLLPAVAFVARRYLTIILCGLIAIQFFQERTVFMMAFRTDAIAFGVLIALWESHPSHRLIKPLFLSRPWRRICILASILCCLSLLGADTLHIVSIRIGLIALLSAILVWIASYDLNLLSGSGVFKKIMLWVGSRSYAMYLIHIPAFFMTREIFHRFFQDQKSPGNYNTWMAIVALTLLISLSELNFRLIESTLRTYGARASRNLRTLQQNFEGG